MLDSSQKRTMNLIRGMTQRIQKHNKGLDSDGNHYISLLDALLQKLYARLSNGTQYPYKLSIRDNKTGTETIYSGKIYALSQGHADRIVSRISNRVIEVLSRQDTTRTHYGIFLDDHDDKKWKRGAKIALGVTNVRRNWAKGYHAGGMRPFSLTRLTLDNIRDLITSKEQTRKTQLPLKEYRKALSVRFYIALVLATAAFTTLVVNVLMFSQYISIQNYGLLLLGVLCSLISKAYLTQIGGLDEPEHG